MQLNDMDQGNGSAVEARRSLAGHHRGRLEYNPPQLRCWGALAELTSGVGNTGQIDAIIFPPLTSTGSFEMEFDLDQY